MSALDDVSKTLLTHNFQNMERNYVIVAHERKTYFTTLQGAEDAAQDYFERTGNIVSVVQVAS